MGERSLTDPHLASPHALADGVIELGAPSLSSTSPEVRLYLCAKRIADVVVALAGIIALLPIWLLVAAAVRLTSPGPVIFRQKRTGQYGVPFLIWKFRTMRADAETVLEEVLPPDQPTDRGLIQIRDDPRVTRVGRLLRAYSLDETPQLINILLGEMSFVGPRPISRAVDDPRGLRRLAARPGLTGVWQVSGRKDTDCDTMLHLDMGYLERRSLSFDLLILLRTVPVVLLGKGAR
jgi:lipopolysaccharide/colanic/teichoic acid biosynthesis glycosyltransferase